MNRKPEKLGTWALLIALGPIVVLAIVFLIYLIATYTLTAGPGFLALFGIIILPFILLLLFAIDCGALIIGIAGIFEKNGNKNAAFLGIILSVTPIALFIALFVNTNR